MANLLHAHRVSSLFLSWLALGGWLAGVGWLARGLAAWLAGCVVGGHLCWTCLLYCASHGKCIFADHLQMSHACQRFWNCYKTLMFCSLLTGCTVPCACHAKRHLNVQKCSVPLSVLHFWLGMCFAPQWRALFQHLNFEKWSGFVSF